MSINYRLWFYLTLSLFLVTAIFSCGNGITNTSGENTNNVDTISAIEDKISIEKVNVYIENSISMEAYENGESNYFRQDLNNLFDILNESQTDWNFFAVNTELYPLSNIDPDYFIDNNKVFTKEINKGKRSETDFKFIFDQIVKESSNGGLHVLVSDLIYSTKKKDIISAKDVANDFESIAARVFKTTADTTGLIIMKMISPYKGHYYVNYKLNTSQRKFKINQNRPYYIIIFGNKELINYLVHKPEFNDVNKLNSEFLGFENYYVFTKISKPEDIYYSAFPFSASNTVFSRAKEQSRKDAIHDLVFDERSISVTTGNILLGLKMNNLPVFSNYLNDLSNYKTNSDNFQILSIAPFSNALVKPLDKKFINGSTHLISVETKKVQEGLLNIKLAQMLPAWVDSTNSINDGRNETVGSNTTFGFDNFMRGIENAYSSDFDYYFSINITLKQD